MRLTDLLGMPVIHESGQNLGIAHDVRLRRTGNVGQPGPLQVEGIVAGPGSIGMRLGYGSREVTGPWLLRVIFGHAARHARYIPWTSLQLEESRIVVTDPFDRLRHPRDLEDQS